MHKLAAGVAQAALVSGLRVFKSFCAGLCGTGRLVSALELRLSVSGAAQPGWTSVSARTQPAWREKFPRCVRAAAPHAAQLLGAGRSGNQRRLLLFFSSQDAQSEAASVPSRVRLTRSSPGRVSNQPTWFFFFFFPAAVLFGEKCTFIPACRTVINIGVKFWRQKPERATINRTDEEEMRKFPA